MAAQNRLLNKRGQILIESIFLTLVVSAVLIIFKQLITYQKSNRQYLFSKSKKEPRVSEPATHNSK